MTKTAAQKQAAYRQRKSDKRSEESTEDQEVSTLSPGADCIPEVETGSEEIDMVIGVTAVDPDPIPTDLVIEKLDEIIGILLRANVPPEPVIPPPDPASKPVGDMTQCMRCGDKLPPTETPRLVRELCHDCVWRN